MADTLLKQDARNRALRTFLVGLATDLLAAAIILLSPLVTSANSWNDLDFKVIGFMLAKTLVATLFSYLMRTVLDKSAVPTPLPPSDPGEPDKNVNAVLRRDEAGYAGNPLMLLLWIVVVVVAIAFAVWLVRILLPGA